MKKSALKVLLSAAVASVLAAPSWAQSPAFAQLLNAVGAPSAPAAPAVPAAARVSATSLTSVAPGSDLLPHFSDPGRVQTIMTIISEVYNGQPLPYGRDGIVFQNREGLLPQEPRGYYHEYTVMPPAGSPLVLNIGNQNFQMEPPNGTRGAERLIMGSNDELYYTPNHYRTFISLQVVP